ncbi:hypothetical protein [Alteribacter aurantiacus]|uniref:hypothetical protein n=1 Tax=Alteribacter aurantiacus TaxID=254410 RepID=UPI00040DE3AE|nr:hypothetical protein [Alteribacter aurantiacus]
MSKEEEKRPQRNIFDEMMFGSAREEDNEVAAEVEEQESDQFSEAQMEQTMAQIAAIMDTAEKLKPYAKHLTPIWEAIKKVANEKNKS